MKNLLEQLQKKGGLTQAQAAKAVEIFRDYMVASAYDPDLVQEAKLKARAKYEQLSDKAADMADKLEEKADEMVGKARKQAKRIVDNLSEMLDEKK